VPKSAARNRRSIATVTSTAVIGASLAVLLLPVSAPLASAAAAPGLTERASLKSPQNTPAENGAQDSVLSGNGESVVFTSNSQLDPTIKTGSGTSAPNYKNVFVRDLVLKRTVMISRGQFDPPPPPGSGSNGGLRYGPDKLLQLQAAAPPPIKDTEPTGNSYTPSISSDGRFVAFSTTMSNMFLEDTSFRAKIVVVDRDPNGDGKYDEEETRFGVVSKIYKYYLISGREGDFGSPYTPKLAGNASRIVWVAYSDGHTSLLTSSLNLQAGTVGPITRVPSASPPLNFFRDQQDDPAISGDGNHIVMRVRYRQGCDCNNPPGFYSIQSADMRQENSVIRVDVDGGKPVSTSLLEIVQHPAVNADGSVIAFVLEEHRLVGDDPPFEVNPFEPITFAVLINGNKITRTDIVSRDNAFNIINGERPGLSADGRYLAFVTDSVRAHDGTDRGTSEFTCIRPEPQSPGLRSQPMLRLNAAAQTPRTTCQVVVRDLIVDLDRRINEQSRLPGTLASPNRPGITGGNGSTVPSVFFSTAPSLSNDGGRVAYDSEATDLVDPEDRRTPQVYVRTMRPTLRADTVAFGQLTVNTTTTKTAQLTHVGFGPINVTQLSLAGTNAVDFAIGGQTCTGQTIHETGSCQVSIRFTPLSPGDKRATLRLRFRDGRESTVDLTGTGTAVPVKDPQFAAGPNPINFGNRLLLSTGPTGVVTITNGGEAALRITAVDIVGPGNPEDYKIDSNTCGAPVTGGGGTCTVAVAFSPKASGGRNAVLRFTDNAPGGPHLVGLTGSANQPTIQVSPGVTPPGRVVSVIGKDFPPGLPVTVKFQDRPGATVIKPADNGTFTAALLVFPKASPETRTIQAVMPQFSGPLATTPLLIVFPTVSPANFVVRG